MRRVPNFELSLEESEQRASNADGQTRVNLDNSNMPGGFRSPEVNAMTLISGIDIYMLYMFKCTFGYEERPDAFADMGTSSAVGYVQSPPRGVSSFPIQYVNPRFKDMFHAEAIEIQL